MVLSHGHYIKDLRYLNRDMRKIVVIDNIRNVPSQQKNNVITLKKYGGEE
jgi:TFIIF-interacting CTD phosphatase-like protein